MERPRSLSSEDKRERFFFTTREKALEFATKLKEEVKAHGVKAMAIRPGLAEEALKVEKMLKPYGISLTEAAKRIVEIEKEKIASVDVSTALSQFILAKYGKSDAQMRTYERRRPLLLS